MNEPIDVVYLWVDGTDPIWRKKRQLASDLMSPTERQSLALYGNVEGRFRDNQELRFSLRALATYFPNHGHVYLLTDSQTPKWLEKSDRVTVIDHRSLIPAGSLPTFDSGNIESYIHRIPGLSEKYFYLNDDVFFGAPVEVADWFWSGGIYVSWSDESEVTDEPLRRDATSLENACRFSNQWLNANTRGGEAHASGQIPANYQSVFRTFAHSPRPMMKSMLFALETLVPEIFESVRTTTFRAWDRPTIVSDFVLRWALATGSAKVRKYSHIYMSTGEDAKASEHEALLKANGALDFFCLNDTTDDAHHHDPRLAKVRETLELMLPCPSYFERQSVLPMSSPARLNLVRDAAQADLLAALRAA